MATKMKIREANKKDLPTLKKLFLEMHKSEARLDKEIVINKQTKERMCKTINEIFQNPDRKIFVAEDNQALTGYVWTSFSPGFTKSGWVAQIFVAKDSRRKGIASKLMTVAFDWMRERGAENIRLTAYKRNKEALAFYKKQSFKKEPAKLINLTKPIK